MIPGARFVALKGRNRVVFEQKRVSPRFIGEIQRFLRGGDNGGIRVSAGAAAPSVAERNEPSAVSASLAHNPFIAKFDKFR